MKFSKKALQLAQNKVKEFLGDQAPLYSFFSDLINQKRDSKSLSISAADKRLQLLASRENLFFVLFIFNHVENIEQAKALVSTLLVAEYGVEGVDNYFVQMLHEISTQVNKRIFSKKDKEKSIEDVLYIANSAFNEKTAGEPTFMDLVFCSVDLASPHEKQVAIDVINFLNRLTFFSSTAWDSHPEERHKSCFQKLSKLLSTDNGKSFVENEMRSILKLARNLKTDLHVTLDKTSCADHIFCLSENSVKKHNRSFPNKIRLLEKLTPYFSGKTGLSFVFAVPNNQAGIFSLINKLFSGKIKFAKSQDKDKIIVLLSLEKTIIDSCKNITGFLSACQEIVDRRFFHNFMICKSTPNGAPSKKVIRMSSSPFYISMLKLFFHESMLSCEENHCELDFQAFSDIKKGYPELCAALQEAQEKCTQELVENLKCYRPAVTIDTAQAEGEFMPRCVSHGSVYYTLTIKLDSNSINEYSALREDITNILSRYEMGDTIILALNETAKNNIEDYEIVLSAPHKEIFEQLVDLLTAELQADTVSSSENWQQAASASFFDFQETEKENDDLVEEITLRNSKSSL